MPRPDVTKGNLMINWWIHFVTTIGAFLHTPPDLLVPSGGVTFLNYLINSDKLLPLHS